MVEVKIDMVEEEFTELFLLILDDSGIRVINQMCF